MSSPIIPQKQQILETSISKSIQDMYRTEEEIEKDERKQFENAGYHYSLYAVIIIFLIILSFFMEKLRDTEYNVQKQLNIWWDT